jgi:hypothetical protein
MTKSKSAASSIKQTFGKRKNGKAKKSSGPKDKAVKKSRGQGK